MDVDAHDLRAGGPRQRDLLGELVGRIGILKWVEVDAEARAVTRWPGLGGPTRQAKAEQQAERGRDHPPAPVSRLAEWAGCSRGAAIGAGPGRALRADLTSAASR